MDQYSEDTWNSFREELKTTKQKIIYKNVTEDLSMKKKRNKIINITRVESTNCLSRYKAKLKFCSHSRQLKNIYKNDS